MAQATGNRPLFVRCDITDVAALKASVDEATKAHGPIRVYMNNAGNDQRHRTPDVDEAFWNWSQAINLEAYFFASQAGVAGMQAQRGGAIVNFTSASYLMGNTDYPVYVTANSGINGMTRALAREFGPDNIRVNALCPGWVLTEKQLEAWADEDSLKSHLGKQCLKDHLKPADIVEPALFLASDASRMMTGQALFVDGGVVVTG